MDQRKNKAIITILFLFSFCAKCKESWFKPWLLSTATSSAIVQVVVVITIAIITKIVETHRIRFIINMRHWQKKINAEMYELYHILDGNVIFVEKEHFLKQNHHCYHHGCRQSYGCNAIYMYIYICIYIKWTVFVNVTTKSAQHAHARMIAIIVEKSPNSSHMYDHGFMDNTNRQAVCKSQKNPLSDSQTAEELHWKP